jgi:nicotinamide-nucleotide amidase
MPSGPDLSDRFRDRDGTLAVAESLTGGLLANHFARKEGAGEWFRGGVVAYQRPVKEAILDIGDAPVVSQAAAEAMAATVARLLDATVGVGVTGVGGPDPQDGIPAGTVWMAVHAGDRTTAELHRFDGGPEEVCEQVCARAEVLVGRALEDATDGEAQLAG